VKTTYKYSIKTSTGYSSDQSGVMTPERHGVVCAVLDGRLPDDLLLLGGAQDLLKAARKVMAGLEERIAYAEQERNTTPVFEGIADLHEAIAKATSNSN